MENCGVVGNFSMLNYWAFFQDLHTKTALPTEAVKP
jgi:hypothetical protein